MWVGIANDRSKCATHLGSASHIACVLFRVPCLECRFLPIRLSPAPPLASVFLLTILCGILILPFEKDISGGLHSVQTILPITASGGEQCVMVFPTLLCPHPAFSY